MVSSGLLGMRLAHDDGGGDCAAQLRKQGSFREDSKDMDETPNMIR